MKPKKSPLFSIIMPVWNAETYVTRSIDSIRQQTEGDWELILVNDGSTDRTAELLAEAVKSDERIRVLSLEKNEGAAEARNAGIAAAYGEYTIFIDADDEVKPELLRRIHKEIADCRMRWRGESPEMVVYGLTECYFDPDGKLLRRKNVIPEAVVSRDEDEVHRTLIRLEEQTIYGYLWNKAYKTELLQRSGIRIPQMRILEDVFYNIEICRNLVSIACIPEPLYLYEKRDGSATSKPIPDYYEIHRERMLRLYRQYEGWQCLTASVLRFLQLRYSRYLFSAVLRKDKGKAAFVRMVYQDMFYQSLFHHKIQEEKNEKDLLPFAGGSRAERIMRFLWLRQWTMAILLVTSMIAWTQKYGKRLFLRVSKG